jgi:hypothetical protein
MLLICVKRRNGVKFVDINCHVAPEQVTGNAAMAMRRKKVGVEEKDLGVVTRHR